MWITYRQRNITSWSNQNDRRSSPLEKAIKKQIKTIENQGKKEIKAIEVYGKQLAESNVLI